jgi:DNA-binding cell septation regulator SpoVG
VEVTEVRIFVVGGRSKLKAKAYVTLLFQNGVQITIKNFRIIDDGIKAPWVGVPTERVTKNNEEKYFEMLWMNDRGQGQIYPKILEAYKNEINKTHR